MTSEGASALNPSDHTLLIVDDLEENRELLARRFRKRGFRVLEAIDGQNALETLRTVRIDLVVLDVMMPGITGLEVLRRIRANDMLAELPVVMATARSESDHVVEAFDLGATDYVAKPIDFAVLHARVIAALKRAASRRRVPSGPPRLGMVLAGRYVLGPKLGEGGFGEVYRATHRELARTVAIKVLRTSHAGPEAVARFRREGMTACRVQHPNAVAVLDSGVTEEGVAFLVMELLEGHSLSEEMGGRGVLSLARCAAIVAPVCDALEAAHQAGIVHRDIKPENVFVHNGPYGEVPKILDFGIAKLISYQASEHPVTAEGLLVGTPIYMAPERFGVCESLGSSDVYSMAVMIYQLLTGKLPFVSAQKMVVNEPMAIAIMHLHDLPLPLREVRPDLPVSVEQLIQRALSKHPEERPRAGEMAAILRAAALEAPGAEFVQDSERPGTVFTRPTEFVETPDQVETAVARLPRNRGDEY